MKAAGRKRMTQAELSRRSGVPQPTINRILKGGGTKGPETGTLIKLAQPLNVTVSWLREGTGPGPLEGKAVEAAPATLPPPPTKFQRHWLTNEEAELLAEIRSLTPASQKRLRTIVGSLKRDRVDVDAVDKL